MSGTSRALARSRRAQAIALQEAGLTNPEIARELGVSNATVWGYLNDNRGPRAPRPVDQHMMGRLASQATGLADAADQVGWVQGATDDQVKRWTADLTRAIRSLSKLRTRVQEDN